MDAGPVTLVVALALGAALYLGVGVFVWRHRQSIGARALTLVLLGAGIWTLCNAIEVSLPDPQDQQFWGNVKYVGIVLLAPALLCFALVYTGRTRVVRRRLVALLVLEPVVVLGALTVPGLRGLVRSIPDDAPYGQYAFAENGPLFWVHFAYTYLIIVVAVGMLEAALLKVSRQHARAWLLIVSCLLPLTLNAAYNLELFSQWTIDPTPLAFSVAGLVLVWGFFRFQLFDLIPVGRRQVVDRIPDAVLVLDNHDRIVDANPAAAHLAWVSTGALVGRAVLDVLPQLAGLIGGTGPDQHSAGGCRAKRMDGDSVDLAVTISPLPDDVRTPNGRLVVLRDVTAQRDIERRLRDLVAERTAIIDTLQRGLYPARLPDIPGLSVAAVLDPAEAETNIGGDFVDVRASGPGRWTLMVGDVVGKGASAATLTALARHTTVALTALGWSPSAVLGEVSRAIAMDERLAGLELDARFCTLALATVEPGVAPTDGVDICLALGGHPRPMLVTAAGDVTEVGTPGSLLGVLPNPEVHDLRLHLAPGDCLVMFTDGVTEARRGEDAFGEHRLAGLLSRLAGTPPGHIVHEVVGAVRSFSSGGEPRDDVAVLAVCVPIEEMHPFSGAWSKADPSTPSLP